VKLFERLIQDAIITHITRNRIISCHQHGFQRMCSCITQLIECLNDWTDSFDYKLGTDAIYLDFDKAFDKKSIGPKIEPCGTPLVTFIQLEDPPGKTTFWRRFRSYHF
jgi:hypothetical protein